MSFAISTCSIAMLSPLLIAIPALSFIYFFFLSPQFNHIELSGQSFFVFYISFLEYTRQIMLKNTEFFTYIALRAFFGCTDIIN